MEQAGFTATMNWVLDDLVRRVDGISQAVLLSRDGLTLGASQGLTREDAEHLAAVAAGLQSLARGAALRVRRRPASPGHHPDGHGAAVRHGGRAGQLPGRAVPGRAQTTAWSPMKWPCSSSDSASTCPPTRGPWSSPRGRGTAVGMTGDERWLDRDAGPVVRPYALTRGRTRPPGLTLGLIDQWCRQVGPLGRGARPRARAPAPAWPVPRSDRGRGSRVRDRPAARRGARAGRRPAGTGPGHGRRRLAAAAQDEKRTEERA